MLYSPIYETILFLVAASTKARSHKESQGVPVARTVTIYQTQYSEKARALKNVRSFMNK